MFNRAEPSEVVPHISPKLAFGLITFPLAVAIGIQNASVLIAVRDYLAQFDPWNNAQVQTAATTLRIICLLVTSLLTMKQWFYYFGPVSGQKDGIFAYKLGAHSNLERFLDFSLCLSGGFLFFISIIIPMWWLLGFSAYCFLVIKRCEVTLRRKKYAEQWIEKGKDKLPMMTLPFSTYPTSQVLGDEFEKRMSNFAASIDGLYGRLNVHAVLSGWVYSHRLHCTYGFLTFLLCYWALISWETGWKSALVSGLLIIGVVPLFLCLAKQSYAWGLRKCGK